MNASPPGARGAGVVAAAVRGAARALLQAAVSAPARRRLADATGAGVEAGAASGQIAVQGAGEKSVRVRRARLEDGPRALHLVRHQLQSVSLPPAARLLVADLVAQTLAQGHSLVAEVGGSGGASEALCGLALCATMWPWDAGQLERQGCCVRCAHSRRLLRLAAHCLRAPALHHKYSVGAVFQVALVVPAESTERAVAARLLAARALQRAAQLAYPLARFDVADSSLGKMLEEMRLNKEWEIHFDVNVEAASVLTQHTAAPVGSCANFIAVYCAKLTAPQAV